MMKAYRSNKRNKITNQFRVMKHTNKRNQFNQLLTIALNAMSYRKTRNGVEKYPSQRYRYNYQGRVEDKESHPSNDQQKNNAKCKGITAAVIKYI